MKPLTDAVVPQERNVTDTDRFSRVDLRAMWGIVLKRRWIFAGVLVLAVGVAIGLISWQVPYYQAWATVVVDPKAPQILGEEVHEVVDMGAIRYWSQREFFQTQYRIVESEAVLQRVVDRLKIKEHDEYLASGPGAKVTDKARENAIPMLQEMLRVDAIRDSRIVKVSVLHWKPELAASLANSIANEYIDFNLEHKLQSTKNAVQWLATQLDGVQSDVEHSEQALHKFKEVNNLLTVSLEDDQSLLMSQINSLQTALNATQAKRIELDARRKGYARLRDADPESLAFTSGEADGTSLATYQLKESYINERRSLVELEERYLPKHPAIVAQRAKVAAALEALQHEADGVVRATEQEYQMAADTEKQLSAAVERAKQHAIEITKKEVEYNGLKRERENSGKLYSLLLGRLKESDISGQIRSNNIRLLDAASIPDRPTTPNRRLYLALALALGLMGGLALVFIVDRLDDSVKSAEEIESRLQLPVFGMIPSIKAETNGHSSSAEKPDDGTGELRDLYIHTHPKSSVAECCRSIRTNILFAGTTRPVRRILVSSPNPREGKTTLAISLGIAMAQSGKRVVLVDTDLRRPRLHQAFGIARTPGLTNSILGDQTLDEVIRTTPVPNLSVLSCGPLPPNPAEILYTDQFSNALDELGRKFDFVILDSPPVSAVTDALVAGRLCEGVLLVARVEQTSIFALGYAVKQLRDLGIPLLGCVLNDLDLENSRYGYYYYYSKYGYNYYSYSYGYSTQEDADESNQDLGRSKTKKKRPDVRPS